MATKEEYMQLVKSEQWMFIEQHFSGDDGKLDFEAVAESYEDVTPKLVEAHFRNYKDAPRGGSRGHRGTAGSAPNKATLLQKGDACPTWLAFSEIIDNVLDNYRIFAKEKINLGTQPHDLEVTIDILGTDKAYDLEDESPQPDACQIRIKENSGGISEDSLTPFLSVGNSDWDKVESSVGVWGNGQKVAMCRLSRFNKVSTRHRDDTENGLYFQLGDRFKESVDDNGNIDGGYFRKEQEEARNYYSEPNSIWQVNYDFLPESAQEDALHHTMTWMTKVPNNTREDLDGHEPDGYVSDKLFGRLSAIFANKIRENKIKFEEEIESSGYDLVVPSMSVIFNHQKKSDVFDILDPITAELGENGEHDGDFDRLQRQFSYTPSSLPPTRGEIVIPQSKITGGKDDLHVSWLIGMSNTNGPPVRRGFMCWGNGKLFELEFTEIQRLKGPYTEWDKRPENSHWKGYLKFWSKDPSLIPWQAPTKWKWDEESKARTIISNLLSAIATPYWISSGQISTDKVQELEEYFGLWHEEGE